MNTAPDIARAVLSRWDAFRQLTAPPAERTQLWSEGGRGVWLDNSWGPAVPYPPVRHDDGTQNYGYIRVKNAPELLSTIPEVLDFPELATFLATINSTESPIESVGCEKSFFRSETKGAPPVYLGSYVDVLFTEAKLNESAENAIHVAGHLLHAVEGCEKWWTNVSMVLQRFRCVPWGLELHIAAHGRDEAEARRLWGVTLDRLGKAVQTLPKDFRRSLEA